MEAEGVRGHSVLAAKTSLTCMCEGAEGAGQGQQQQQLNIHCAESFSPPVTTFRASLGATSTRQTHTNRPLRRGR